MFYDVLERISSKNPSCKKTEKYKSLVRNQDAIMMSIEKASILIRHLVTLTRDRCDDSDSSESFFDELMESLIERWLKQDAENWIGCGGIVLSIDNHSGNNDTKDKSSCYEFSIKYDLANLYFEVNKKCPTTKK